MIVNYVHIADPTTIRTYDTEKALRNNPFIDMSQKSFDEMELQRLLKDKEKGVILSYNIEKE